MTCAAKHTKPQIPDADWRCPRCGIGPDHESGGFVIINAAHGADGDCARLHSEDEAYCHGCGHDTTGQRFARAYSEAKSLVPCEHCKGNGFVPAVTRRAR